MGLAWLAAERIDLWGLYAFIEGQQQQKQQQLCHHQQHHHYHHHYLLKRPLPRADVCVADPTWHHGMTLMGGTKCADS
jgi:hypothetical protein